MVQFPSGIVKRGVTIVIVVPIVLWLLSTKPGTTGLVWVLTYLAMIEWTALKRHLKLSLLDSDCASRFSPPKGYEFPSPVAKTNTFIAVKSLLCSFICPCAIFSDSLFHFARTCYFFFWVLFTLTGQNKSETKVSDAKRRISTSAAAPPSPLQTTNNTKLLASCNASDDDLAAKCSPKSFVATSRRFALHELEMIASRYTTDLFLSFALEYFGFVWVSGLSYGLLMYAIPDYGPVCTISVISANWANDIAALIVGRSLKGHTRPLYPRISPNKSVEGAIAGVLMNAIVASILVPTLAPALVWPANPYVLFFFVGLLMGILGVIGDLLESLMKRTAGIKDTGGIFPGHGGVLDRIDGLLLCYPVAYWLLWWYIEASNYSPATVS